MGAFGDFTYPESNRLFVGKPIEDIKAAQTALQTQYEANSDYYDQLDILSKSELVRDDDTDIKKAAIENIRKGIQSTVDMGNFEHASKIVKGLYKDHVTNELLNAAKSEYLKEQAYSAMLDARLSGGVGGYSSAISTNTGKSKSTSKGSGTTEDATSNLSRSIGTTDLSQEYVQKAKAISKAMSSKLVKNADGTITGGFQGFIPNKQYDAVELADELVKGWEYDQTSNTYTTGDPSSDILLKSGVVTKQTITKDELEKGIKQYLGQHQGYQDWLDSKYVLDNYGTTPTADDIKTLLVSSGQTVNTIGADKKVVADTTGDATYTAWYNTLKTKYPKATDDAINKLIHETTWKNAQEATAIDLISEKKSFSRTSATQDVDVNSYKTMLDKWAMDNPLPSEFTRTEDGTPYGVIDTKTTSSLKASKVAASGNIAAEAKTLLKQYAALPGNEDYSNTITLLAKREGITIDEAIKKYVINGTIGKTIKAKMGSTALDKLVSSYDQLDIVNQREKEANDAAAQKLGYANYAAYESGNITPLEKHLNDYAKLYFKSKGDADWANADINDVTKDLNLLASSNLITGSYAARRLLAEGLNAKYGTNYSAEDILTPMEKSKNLVKAKDAYLEETAKLGIKTNTSTTLMPGDTKEQIKSRTDQVTNFFKNPLNFIDMKVKNEDGDEVALNTIPPKKDGTYDVSNAMLTTMADNPDGSRSFKITIAGIDGKSVRVSIPVSKFKETMSWVNTPQERLNTWLYTSGGAGIKSRTLTATGKDGKPVEIKVHFPIDINSKIQSGYKFYNDSDFSISYPGADGTIQMESGEEAYNDLKEQVYKGNITL